jgi:hypothetical protein
LVGSAKCPDFFSPRNPSSDRPPRQLVVRSPGYKTNTTNWGVINYSR